MGVHALLVIRFRPCCETSGYSVYNACQILIFPELRKTSLDFFSVFLFAFSTFPFFFFSSFEVLDGTLLALEVFVFSPFFFGKVSFVRLAGSIEHVSSHLRDSKSQCGCCIKLINSPVVRFEADSVPDSELWLLSRN